MMLGMKTFNYLGLLLAGLTGACHSAPDQHTQTVTKETLSNTAAVKTVDSVLLIIPGKQVGCLYLGQNMKDVDKLLGRPDDGDAAMGSALGIWYSLDKKKKDTLKTNPLIIFSAYRDSNMVVKDVKQISVSAPGFSTAEGLHTGVSLAQLKAIYPSLKKTESYVGKSNKDSLIVYDVIDKGVAFDIQQDICTEITVHQEDKAVNAVYLTVHPEWKKIQ